jgi:hemerythrin superfamily protein
MQIYDELKKDHDHVKKLLHELVTGNKDTKACKELVSQIRDALIPHSRAEEAVFYNSLRELSPGKDLAMHGYKEHLEAETLLRTLQTLQIFDAKGISVAKKLEEALKHHISEEETEMFAAGRQLFLDQEAVQMGEAFKKMKSEVKDESILGTTWDMVVNMMPERLRGTFRKSSQTVNH